MIRRASLNFVLIATLSLLVASCATPTISPEQQKAEYDRVVAAISDPKLAVAMAQKAKEAFPDVRLAKPEGQLPADSSPPTPEWTPKPQFPFSLRRAGIQGVVYVAFVVEADGSVRQAKAVSADQPEFAVAAENAVRRWKFKPGLRAGQPTPALIYVPIAFALR